MAKKKQRLDTLLYERGLAPTRSKAQGIIMAGEVLVNELIIDKPGTKIDPQSDIKIKERPPYVSRGGEKLVSALADFGVQVTNLICADVGASTGGFTDCLLQHGAKRVYAIDVGYGQLAHKLRIDARVVVLERTNARYVETLAEPVDLAVIDASFISLKLLLPSVKKWLKPQAQIIALIKPQFEAGKHDIAKGGVVKDVEVHRRVIRELLGFADTTGFTTAGLTVSPIKGLKQGNTEFLMWLKQGMSTDAINTDAAIAAVMQDD